MRYLLADEVGLGKTIEAGLVMHELKLRGLVCRTLVVAPKGLATQWVAEMHELKLRGLVCRTLVVAPKGLATQWVAEMQIHFNEQFHLVLGEDISTLQRLTLGVTIGTQPGRCSIR